jgi:2-deoxy-D-gluconate 3-dehydrogenase
MLDCDWSSDVCSSDLFSLPEDVSSLDGIKRLAAAYHERESALDILVNNAGLVRIAPLEDFSEEAWDDVLDLNIKSPFFLVQKLLPALRAAARAERPAKVINIVSSDALSLYRAEHYSYKASKSGLVFLTRALANRLATDHITVNAIAPGPFATDMNSTARDHSEMVAGAVPMGRIGKHDDMAACAVYLASRGGDFVTGVTIPVDGGLAEATSRPDWIPRDS